MQARLTDNAGDARPARSGLSRRYRARDVERPGRIIATHDVPIERPRRPRTAYEPRFMDIVDRIRKEIRGERKRQQAAGGSARLMQSEFAERAVPWVASLALLLIWEIGCTLLNVPEFVLPKPTVVLAALVQWAGPIWFHASHTLITTVLGFAIWVAARSSHRHCGRLFRLAYRGFYPMLVGFNSIPKVAIVPVLVIWFGIGVVPAVLTAFLMSFFPIAVNVATGLATVEPEMEDDYVRSGPSRATSSSKSGCRAPCLTSSPR